MPISARVFHSPARTKLALPIFACFLATGLFCAPARADVTITPIWDGTITSDPNAATIEGTIETAIGNLEGYLANNVTVDITFAEMGSGLGQSDTTYYETSYASYLTALQNNQILTPQDDAAIASLGSGTAVNPVNGTANIIATQSLLEALDVNVQGDGPLSGVVTGTVSLNTSIMNLTRSGSQNPAKYDLESAVTHEMDEVLGIGGAGSHLSSGTTGDVGPMDLFRYSAPNTRSFTESVSATPAPYFSINSGTTDLVHFNQNYLTDGSDFGDWGNGAVPAQVAGNSPPQVQDAYAGPTAEANLGPNEMTAFDVVGWNLTTQGVDLEDVPEPPSLALIPPGLIALGVWRWRRRNIR
jgi:hypothetical protein